MFNLPFCSISLTFEIGAFLTVFFLAGTPPPPWAAAAFLATLLGGGPFLAAAVLVDFKTNLFFSGEAFLVLEPEVGGT